MVIKAISLSVLWQVSSVQWVKEQHRTLWTQRKHIWNNWFRVESHLIQSLKCINKNFPLITNQDRLFITSFAFVKCLLPLQVLYRRTICTTLQWKLLCQMEVSTFWGETWSLEKAISSCKIGDTSETIYIIQLIAWIEQMNPFYSLAMTNRYTILSLLMLYMY